MASSLVVVATKRLRPRRFSLDGDRPRSREVPGRWFDSGSGPLADRNRPTGTVSALADVSTLGHDHNRSRTSASDDSTATLAMARATDRHRGRSRCARRRLRHRSQR